MRNRWAVRRGNADQNQSPIVTALEAVGASVTSLAGVGEGCPDLLVGYRRSTYLLEVKNPDVKPSERKLRESQSAWLDAWRGGAVAVVHTVDDALVAIGAVGGKR